MEDKREKKINIKNEKNKKNKKTDTKKKILKYALILVGVLALVFISAKLYFNITGFKGDIDSIVVVLQDENKDGVSITKTIEDKGEIDLFVKALNSAKVSKKVKNEEIDPLKTSTYKFFDGEGLVKTIVFLDKESSMIINKDKIYKVKYIKESLYHIYKNSMAKETEIKE